MGHQGVCHFFRTDSTQFSLCTASVYEDLCQRYGLRNMLGFREYEVLKEDDAAFKAGRAASRRAYLASVHAATPVVFNLPDGAKFKPNILKYRKDYTGHHPTQKPVALMEDLIRTYTNPGDTVLDPTMGSGSTGVACVNTGRRFIGIERDAGYFATAERRIAEAQPQLLAAE
jgi:site-specific DNA-methyltransferase (adenine-specific)